MATANESKQAFDDKTREAFSSAFGAMSEWRDEITKSTQQHGEKVFDKLSAAARSAGWPDDLIQTTKAQLLQASKFQTDMIDHITTAWEEHLRSASEMGERAKDVADKSADLTTMALAPAQFWLQMMEMWRKNWSNAAMTWTGGAGGGDKRDLGASKH